MNKKLALLLTTVFAFCSVESWAAPPPFDVSDGISLFVEPLLQKGLGGTSYDLAFDLGGGDQGLSRLEFPQASLEAGGAVGFTINRGGRREWLVQVQAAHSTIPMPGTMHDYDWVQPAGYPKVPFSYTHSEDTTESWRAGVEVARALFSGDRWALGWYFTYGYQSSSHVEDSATGWQYSWNPAAGAYDLYLVSDPTPDVLEYRLTSHTIGLGLLADVEVFPRFTLSAVIAYAPVYVSDEDDHKLRTKLSTASGWGHGLYSDLRAVLLLDRIGGVRPYLCLEAAVRYYVADTLQRQYWYGNADAANGAPQGTEITDVGHVITCAQWDAGMFIGFSF